MAKAIKVIRTFKHADGVYPVEYPEDETFQVVPSNPVAGQISERGAEVALQEGWAKEVAPPAGAAAAPGDGPNATESAIEKAAALGVDLSAVTGSGAGGRILVRDVEAAAKK